MPTESKSPKIRAPGDSRKKCLRDLANLGLDWDRTRADTYVPPSGKASESQKSPAFTLESGSLVDQGTEKLRVWINKLSDESSDKVFTKLLAAGCDILFLSKFTYLYCSPDPDPVQKARLLIARLPNYIRDARKLLKSLKRLETPERIELLRIDPEMPRLERYVEHLEAALKRLELTRIRGSFRPFYLLCMSYYLRAAYPEQWRGRSLRKTIHADIRDLVNAGFLAHGIVEVITEDQVRHQCERFSKRHPAFARFARKQAMKLPIEFPNIYEEMFQCALRRIRDNLPS